MSLLFGSTTGAQISLLVDSKIVAGLGNFDSQQIATSVVPVPAALPLFATGLGVLGFAGWRRKRKAAVAAA